MAACDNLYGNRTEWNELDAFIVETHPEWIELYMYPEPLDDKEQVRIMYIADVQGWLLENCPLDWVIERINENCHIQTVICGKPHHER